MTTQIELNEELVKEAFRLTDFQTEKELIEFALQELIRTRRKKRNLLDLSGQIQFADNYEPRTNKVENMSNSELLDRLRQLSRLEKFKIVQFLMTELAKEEGIVLDNEAAEIIGAVHTSNLAAEQLVQLLEKKEAKNG